MTDFSGFKYVFQCDQCGGDFGASRSDAAVCSTGCRDRKSKKRNPEAFLAASRSQTKRWRLRNPEKAREADRRNEAKNREQKNEKARRYRERNAESLALRRREKYKIERAKMAELDALKSSRVAEALALLDMVEAGTIVIKQAGE